jgi:hypothetical protein
VSPTRNINRDGNTSPTSSPATNRAAVPSGITNDTTREPDTDDDTATTVVDDTGTTVDVVETGTEVTDGNEDPPTLDDTTVDVVETGTEVTDGNEDPPTLDDTTGTNDDTGTTVVGRGPVVDDDSPTVTALCDVGVTPTGSAWFSSDAAEPHPTRTTPHTTNRHQPRRRPTPHDVTD